VKKVVGGFYDELFISATSMAAMPISYVNGNMVGKTYTVTLEISSLVRQWELED
jgi:D-alanine transaminase/branched-chain amino acid aminotransferase